MIGSIVCCMCFSLCGLAFMLIAITKKNTLDPINFFSGDDSLKEKVKDVKRYNKHMYKLYTVYGLCLIVIGIISFISTLVSIILMVIFLTIGLIFVYYSYKNILKENS